MSRSPSRSPLYSPTLDPYGGKEWTSAESSARSSDDHDRRPPEMTLAPGLRNLNPMRFFTRTFSYHYQKLPTLGESRNASFANLPRYPWPAADRWRFGVRLSLTKIISLAIALFVLLSMIIGKIVHHREHHMDPGRIPYAWEHFQRLNGYYNGIQTIVGKSAYEPENQWNKSAPITEVKIAKSKLPKGPPVDPVPFNPYPNYTSTEYISKHHKVSECFIDEAGNVPVPDIYAYPGVPQHMAVPSYGSYEALGLEQNMCFDRFGRLGPYGLSYNETLGGLGAGTSSENAGAEKVFEQAGYTDYRDVNWGESQKRCYEKNKARFEPQTDGKERVKRHAYVLRTWTGYEYKEHQMFTLRAMVNELNLKSGGEYDVHLLLHVKDNSIPIWADKATYNATLEANIPREFWNITTLWSEPQLETYYPDPFPDNFVNMAGSSVHGVYRSAHFALQWFSQQHPEYDFFWNWEMDLRYSGHYYEFNNRIGEWAKEQPRKGLWERNSRFYMPQIHGDWKNFTKFVEHEIAEVDGPANNVTMNGPLPVWGPVHFNNTGRISSPEGTDPPTTYEEDDYKWGVGEDADLIVFNPIFDTSKTNWVFRDDVTGYNTALPIPPRRAAIITVARLSKRLLDTMHEETWRLRHTMFPEMWPPSVCLHHGLKAVYAPHPVYFDRDWDANYMDIQFNRPAEAHASPFGWGEHNMLGSSFYYNSGFSGALWRRWLGQAENNEGGRKYEVANQGRMCIRSTLHHPVKHEDGPTEE